MTELKPGYRILIHGGAGAMSKGQLTQEQEADIHMGLGRAVYLGQELLLKGGSALEAVEAAVIELENNPWFNAGTGAVLTHKGEYEMDAAIMEGKGLEAGSVSGLRFRKNPVSVAKAVLEKSNHVMLASDGAEEFADSVGISRVSNDVFGTKMRRNQWERYLETGDGSLEPSDQDYKFGTVGAVALDL